MISTLRGLADLAHFLFAPICTVWRPPLLRPPHPVDNMSLIGGLCCPGCTEPFYIDGDSTLPLTLSCGHVFCAPCADAIQLLHKPACLLCKAAVAVAVPNAAMRQLAAAWLANSADLEGRVLSGSRGYSPPPMSEPYDVLTVSAQSGDEPGAVAEVREEPATAEVTLITGAFEDVDSVSDAIDKLRHIKEIASDKAATLLSAYDAISSKKASMHTRFNDSLALLRGTVHALKVELDNLVEIREKEARATLTARDKALSAQMDELTISAAQLSCAASICDSAVAASSSLSLPKLQTVLHDVTGMCGTRNGAGDTAVACGGTGCAADGDDTRSPSAVQPVVSPVVFLSVDASALRSVIPHLAQVFDAECIECKPSGAGAVEFVVGNDDECKKHNIALLTLTTSDGEPFTRFVLGDVDVKLRESKFGDVVAASFVTPSMVRPGVLQLAYQVLEASLSRIHIAVSVRGMPAGEFTVERAFQCDGVPQGKLSRLTQSGRASGLAVHSNGSLVAISNAVTCDVIVCKADNGDVVGRFGRRGAGRLMFGEPEKMCLSPHGNILVAERENKRVQEVTWDGKWVRFVGDAYCRERNFPVSCVAANTSIIVLGLATHTTEGAAVFDAVSGDHVRTMTNYRFDQPTTGICIAPTGSDVVMVLRSTAYVFTHTAADNRLFEAESQFLRDPNDVLFAYGDMLAVCDYGEGCVRLVNRKTGAEMKRWGREGMTSGVAFSRPTAMALAKGVLYVLDFGGRVYSFK